jgi:hypothetical protein
MNRLESKQVGAASELSHRKSESHPGPRTPWALITRNASEFFASRDLAGLNYLSNSKVYFLANYMHGILFCKLLPHRQRYLNSFGATSSWSIVATYLHHQGYASFKYLISWHEVKL